MAKTEKTTSSSIVEYAQLSVSEDLYIPSESGEGKIRKGADGEMYLDDEALAKADKTPRISTLIELKAFSGTIVTQTVVTTDPLNTGLWKLNLIDTTTPDNSVTKIRDGNNRLWERVYDNFINLKWFGAKGDGIADDTNKINEAINYLSSLGGGTLFAPVGTYITETIIVPAGVLIIGENKLKTIFMLKALFIGNLFHCFNCTRGGLSNFTVHGNKQNGAIGSGVHIAADTLGNGAKSTASIIRDLFVSDFKLNGIEALAVTWIFTIENNHIQYCDGYGIYNTTTDNAFYNNNISNCGKDGFYNFGGSNTRIIGGKVISNGRLGDANDYAGIHFESCNRCLVIGVECQDNYYHGWFISNSEDNNFIGVLSDGNNAHIRPNQFTVSGSSTWADGNGYGFKLYRCKNSQFTGSATNYSISSPSQYADRYIEDSQNIDFLIRVSNQLNTGNETNSFNIKRLDSNVNPQNGTATADFNWLNNQFRLRLGGSGEGVTNGFDIQSVGNLSLFKINQDRSVVTGSMFLNSLLQISNPNNPAANFKLDWLNDVARIRIGGSGTGAGNGFDFQAAANTSLFRVDGNGKGTIKKLIISESVGGDPSNQLVVFDNTTKEIKYIDRQTDKTQTKNTNYTVLASDFNNNGTAVIYANASAETITITCPPVAILQGLSLIVVKTDSSANIVTIKGYEAELINGQNTHNLYTQNSFRLLKSNGISIYTQDSNQKATEAELMGGTEDIHYVTPKGVRTAGDARYVKGSNVAASADTAANLGETYSQAEVQAILTELRDLKTKMRNAGILNE